MVDSSSNWVQELWDILCQMYRAWGGDCKDLGPAPTNWVDTVRGAYQSYGAPNFTDGASKIAFLDLLTTLQSLLGEPDNSLGPADTDRLLNLITDLRNDLGTGA